MRNLTEDIAILLNNKENSLDLDCHYDNVSTSMDFVAGKSKYRYIKKFYGFLQSTVLHYTPGENAAESGYDHIILFNLSYAISIHEVRSLEYDSVKIIIPSDVEDDITKNIFYIVIT